MKTEAQAGGRQRRYSREPHYLTGESRGQLARLLTATHRSYLILQWCAYPDAVTEDALYEIESTKRFGAQCSTNDAVLDETTTLSRPLKKSMRVQKMVISGVPHPLPTLEKSLVGRSERSAFGSASFLGTFSTAC